jgi:hypothetical protein
MAKYKVTRFAKFLMFTGISGIILFGGVQMAEKMGFDNLENRFNFKEIQETLKENIREKIDEKKNGNSKVEDNYISTDRRLEEKLILLIEENERLAEELKQCKNKNESLVGGE